MTDLLVRDVEKEETLRQEHPAGIKELQFLSRVKGIPEPGRSEVPLPSALSPA
jgi:hypothetical protein